VVPEPIRIPSRFNGPLQSGQGGYSAGVAAAYVDAVPEVTLRSPVPLDRELQVTTDRDGSARVLDGDTLVAEARSIDALDLEPPAVTLDEARAAVARYRGLADGPFSRCFVCGMAREDSFGVFPGAVDDRALVASPWTPSADTADGSGAVRPEFVWAVLDCPGAFGSYTDGQSLIGMLARMSVRIDAPVVAGDEHVVIGWPIETDGRKRYAGTAVLASDGTPLAVSRQLLIEPRAA
jgi:hypothetical protein